MDNKAQGSLEYLLLIGGAILVAAVILALLFGFLQTGSQSAGDAQSGAQDVLQCDATAGEVWDSTTQTCKKA